ncbi:MAG: tail fiber domain-containing protein [Melioribacteraceae bacterium]|nr:tail fiber domain-containing protein [Melioribacteraceae bacterium]
MELTVGYQAYASSPSATNEVTLGNNTVTTLRCNTQTITGLSDARDKKNIKNLTLGINFIMKIKPRQFNWDRREWYKNNVSDGSKTNETPTAGFIAQELDEVQTSEKAEWLNLVLKSNKERWEATYGNLLPVMVKAIQDLKNENDELKTANSKLAVVTSEAIKNINNENKELKIKLANYEQIQNMLVVEIEKLKSSNTRITKVNLVLK